MTKTKRVLATRGPGRPAGSDKSGAHTREHLLETARALLAEKGLGQLSLREIADRAQVNPALLHYYFGNKEDLRSALQDSSFKQLAARLAEVTAGAGKPTSRLESAVRGLVEAMFADPMLHRLVLQHALGSEASEKARFDDDFVKPLQMLFGDILKEAGRGDDVELCVSSLLGIVTMTVLFELRTGGQRKKLIADHCAQLSAAVLTSQT